MGQLLDTMKPYAVVYKMLRQVLDEENTRREATNLPHHTVGMIIRSDRMNLDQRRYNSKTVQEIAAVFKSSDGAPPAI
jgi:hypothetical protein